MTNLSDRLSATSLWEVMYTYIKTTATHGIILVFDVVRWLFLKLALITYYSHLDDAWPRLTFAWMRYILTSLQLLNSRSIKRGGFCWGRLEWLTQWTLLCTGYRANTNYERLLSAPVQDKIKGGSTKGKMITIKSCGFCWCQCSWIWIG